MDLNQYIQSKQTIKPNQDIAERWQNRIVQRGLQNHGRAGAEQYLADYGTNIKAPKVVMLARQAELMGFSDMALGFWAKAFELETGIVTDLSGVAVDLPVTALTAGLMPDFPDSLQPGTVAPMQPSDAKRSRSYYINHPEYWGQPKREGEKLIIFGGLEVRLYQTRSMRLRGAPSIAFDHAIREAAQRWGPFILEGELYFIDVEGQEHQDGARCAARNIQLGFPAARPLMRFSGFSCLFERGDGPTAFLAQSRRIELAAYFMRKLERIAPEIFVEMPTARTTEEKQALCDQQQAEGREGEIFFLPGLTYTPGKSNDDYFVRCKYLTEPITYVITSVSKSTKPEQVISGFDVSTLEGKAMGKIGTGYTHLQQQEILDAHLANPGRVKVICVSRGFTVSGKLREGRFIDLAETAQESPEGEQQ